MSKKSLFCQFSIKSSENIKGMAHLPTNAPHTTDKPIFLIKHSLTVLVNNILNKKNNIYVGCVGSVFVRWCVGCVGWQSRKSDFVGWFLAQNLVST